MVCAIALASSVASLGGAAALAVPCTPGDVWVRAVQPRAGSPLEIELGGDASREREVVVKVKDPRGGSARVPFPPVPQGGSASSLRLIGGILDRDYKGYSLEVQVRDMRTGEILAISSTTVG
jgi:hypothetical protein